MDTLTIDYEDKNFEEKFVESLHYTGFAIINKHPIKQNLINEVYDDWKIFFNSKEKHTYLFDYDKQDGYFPFKSENAYNSKRKDLKEFFHIYPLWGRYPDFISKKTLKLFQEITDLGESLLQAIDSYSPSEIRKKYTEPLHRMSKSSHQNLMRVIHYPPIRYSDHPEEIRAAAHTDINLITLLISGSQPGLQVKNKNGEWINIKSKKGQIVINTGDMLKECSGAYFPSTIHRVINPKESKNVSRFSIPLFFHPRPDVILSNRYTADSYLLKRLKEIGLK